MSDHSKDVFVHVSAIEYAGMSTLNGGQRVSFEVVANQKTGKFSTENMRAAGFGVFGNQLDRARSRHTTKPNQPQYIRDTCLLSRNKSPAPPATRNVSYPTLL